MKKKIQIFAIFFNFFLIEQIKLKWIIKQKKTWKFLTKNWKEIKAKNENTTQFLDQPVRPSYQTDPNGPTTQANLLRNTRN